MREGWEVKSISDVCTVIAGQSPKSSFYNYDGVGLPFYQGKKLFGDKFISAPNTWTSKITKEALEDDILMSVRAPVGPINFATERICIGRGLAAIRAEEKISKEYLFYFLMHNENEITGNTGAVFNSINKKQIGDLKILMPATLPEQTQIVKTLDLAFAKLDQAKVNLEQNLHNAKELFQSKLNEVFSQRGEGWEEKTLKDTCIVERGSSPRPIKRFVTDDEDGVNWVKIGDTKNVEKYIYTTKEKITKEGAKKSRFVDIGDFILSNSMSFGRPYIMKTQGYIHDGWFVFRLPENIDAEFFWYLLVSPNIKEQFQGLASGAIVKNISGDLVKKTILHIPSVTIQKEIVKELDNFSQLSKELEANYQQKLTNLEELKKSILQKAFAGELP